MTLEYIREYRTYFHTSQRKKPKKNPLTKEDKRKNQILSRERVLNENVIGILKRFKIISDRYRNRRKRFELRFNLITAYKEIYDYMIKINC